MKEPLVWFVTGSSRGLGRSLVEEILKAGHKVMMTARNIEPLRDLVSQYPGHAATAKLDMNDATDIRSAINAALSAFGKIDVLVNNAGFAILGAVEEVPVSDARLLMETNYFGPVALIQAVLPSMRERRSGHIINVSSIGGFVALKACGQYSATKFALEGMSEALQQEVAPLGIKVTIVEPNGVRTDFLSKQSLQVTENLLGDYDGTRGAQIAAFDAANGVQPSDPVMGSKAIIQLAESPRPPLRFIFSLKGIDRVRAKLSSVEADLAEWRSLSNSVSFEPVPDV